MATSPEEMVGAFQQYQDASFDQAQRHLRPGQEAQQRRFEQQMVNKGLEPGSQAYNLAQAQMQRGMNDQNNAAAFGAMQFGLGAQQQGFGQDFQNRTMDMQKDQFGRSLNQRESEFGRNLGLQRDQLGEQGRQFDVGMSQRESEFGRNFGLQGQQFGLQERQFGLMEQQQNFNNMLGLGDFGMRLADFTNRNTMQDYNMQEGMLSHAPGGSFNPIDTQGAYNASMQGANNVASRNADNYGALMGAVGNIGQGLAMPSALEFKIMHGETDQKTRNHIAAKMLAMPVYNWEYKPQYKEKGDPDRFGVLANDFNGNFIDNEDEQTIDLQRYTSALHVTVQELFHECRRLENLLWHVSESQGIPLDGKPYSAERGRGEVFDIAEKLDTHPRPWVDVAQPVGA